MNSQFMVCQPIYFGECRVSVTKLSESIWCNLVVEVTVAFIRFVTSLLTVLGI